MTDFSSVRAAVPAVGRTAAVDVLREIGAAFRETPVGLRTEVF